MILLAFIPYVFLLLWCRRNVREDNGLTKEAIQETQELIVLPGDHSLNVAVAGSIVMYDRITKLSK